jgi:DNA polymerase-3 subunit gamma/tau
MSLYNKFRPMGYSEVIGQEGILSSLKNMVAENRVSSTILFYGPRGTGKTTCARIFAKALNCLNPKEPGVPCGECENCKDIANGDSLNVIEIDGASATGVNDMREIKAASTMVGIGGGWKVFIIDECHMLSKAAQNSALKMLEESPDKTVFILATTELHKVEGTIVSRALMFDFRPVTVDIVADRLSKICKIEGFEFEEAALIMIAKIAHGGVRDSISILERVAVENGNKILVSGIVRSLGITPTETVMKLGNVLKGDYKSSIEIASSVVNDGNDIFQFFNSAIDYYRGVLMLKLGMNHLVKVENQMMSNMDNVSGSVSQEQISKAISILEDGIGKYKYTEDKQILLEITLYKIADNVKIQNQTNSINEVKVPMQIDEDKINMMMQSQLQKFMANINLGGIVASKPIDNTNIQEVKNILQVENSEVRHDTVNKAQYRQENAVKNDDLANKMLAYLKQNWNKFLNILKGNGLDIVSTTIEVSEPISFENNTLKLKFSKDYEMLAEMFNGQMVGDTAKILSNCMGVSCNVVAFVESTVNEQDTVNRGYNNKPEESKKEIEMLKFSPDIVVETTQKVEEAQDSFEVKNIAGDTFMANSVPEYQQPIETQSDFGLPIEVVEEEVKMSKDDPVNMNMLDMMF